MPPLNAEGLWHVQAHAIQNLEKSLADNRPRSLIQMATGSGKTFTAVSFIYRLIKFAGAQRILFLVDRTNLGRQTLAEFQKYESPSSKYKFSEEYNVQLLRKNVIDPASRVCITTIQRLYSMLKGEDEFDEANEEGSMFEAGAAAVLTKEPLPVVYNPNIPIETFDYIVTDECHRSIYNLWRQVLEYFDAFLVGLTATPPRLPTALTSATTYTRSRQRSAGAVPSWKRNRDSGCPAGIAVHASAVSRNATPTCRTRPISASLWIEEDDFYEAPFAQLGGLGKAHELFGDGLPSILHELNERLAA
jgi:hypothetical protein